MTPLQLPFIASAESDAVILLLLLSLTVVIVLMVWIVLRARNVLRRLDHVGTADLKDPVSYIRDLRDDEVAILLCEQKRPSPKQPVLQKASVLVLALLFSNSSDLFAQANTSTQPPLLGQPGIIITLILIAIPLFIAVLLLILKVNNMIGRFVEDHREKEAKLLADYFEHLEGEAIDAALLKRKASLAYSLDHHELSGYAPAEDAKGIVRNVDTSTHVNFVTAKRRSEKRPPVDQQLSKLVLWYLGCAVFWLLVGTTAGEYLGIKFVAPDVDHTSWLSFGRLRPVHTNMVFWGWSSLAMLGLGYYVVATVSNTTIARPRHGWISLVLINTSVILGSLCLMAGINNGGGEYREYTWPVMSLFGLGLLLTLLNFITTIARRKTKEIYVSNWYIVSAIIFTLVIVVIAYWPGWQNGLGETIIQGYYMHQGVGMWFMLFNLGLVYYFLPQQLNKPIYSYSLGILAFWTQILFYTLIGTHHFVFSSISWWLQTVAIVGSMGMLIPVFAGTTNFLMTFKGAWNKVASSYTLPFYLVGIVFYFTGSFQGTAEAFRYTNLLWHFTDFTVAHSHLTMYGIIAFLLWASIYAIVPRITGSEPPQAWVGVHFWLAFLGLMFYTLPLMIGGTLKGLLWMDGKPFMESVVLMAPYWLWRAIGGTLMWLSHLVFAYNFYRMTAGHREVDIKALAFEKLKQRRAGQPEALA